MDYRELRPGPALAPFVRCFWLLADAAPSAGVERVVPDGCAEIVLNRGASFRRFEGGTTRVQAEALLVGQLRRSIAIAPTGAVDLAGIRFEPGGLFALLGLPMHELTDLDLCLGQVDPALCAGLAAAADRPDPDERLAALEAALAARLAKRGRAARANGLVTAAVRRLEQPGATAGAAAGELGVSRRSLERAFRLEVGLAPRRYARIRRLQAVLRRAESGRSPGWAALAAAHGYADQAHLIRDFRLLAGTTPARWLAERTALERCFELGDPSRPSNP